MENKQIKTIAVLTSGGDSPGMNAAIRAVVRTAISRDIDVIGVRHGYTGLINDDTFPMNVRSVSEIIQRGGTILHTSRCEEFMHLSGQLKAKKTCEENGIDAVVVIGGDGSYRWRCPRWAFPASACPARSTMISAAPMKPSGTTPL